MKLLRLYISNFRGIQSLDWKVRGRVTCFVGRGDSTKTTILDAIDLVLSAKWNVPFADSDFYDCDFEQQITIRAVIADVPASLLTEDKFGLYQVGWNAAKTEEVEFEDGVEPALIVELSVNSSLEPEWAVMSLDGKEPRHVSSRDREQFGVARLGEFIDRHTTWSRGSFLAQMGSGTKSVREVIADANRSAMSAVRKMAGTSLHGSASDAERLAREFGVAPKVKYVPGLDSRAFGESSASLALHDGDVPVRMSGLGSRRLLAAAIQKSVLKGTGAILVDEIEYGLEPHRTIHLIRTLTDEDKGEAPQVFMTTHSPVAVAELGAGRISVVQCIAGITTVHNVPDDSLFAGTVRSCPEALLGRKVIVCEGPTEGGMCWALDSNLESDRGSFGVAGVVVANGGGSSQGPGRAMALSKLGFDTAYFGDSDADPVPSIAEMQAAGVSVFLWEGIKSTEERVFADLPITGLQRAVSLACDEKGEESVRDQVRSRLSTGSPDFDLDIAQWMSAKGNEAELRTALAAAAKHRTGSWFKNWGAGELLAEIVLDELGSREDVPTSKTLSALAAWAVPKETGGLTT